MAGSGVFEMALSTGERFVAVPLFREQLRRPPESEEELEAFYREHLAQGFEQRAREAEENAEPESLAMQGPHLNDEGWTPNRSQITSWTDELAAHVRAPYRFAPLNERIAPAPAMPDLDKPLEGGLNAELVVEWIFETPFLVGAGNDQNSPFTINGIGASIPGATWRGSLRTILEVLSYSRLVQTNHNYRFALRDFNHKYYNALLKLSKPTGPRMLAGWLSRGENGKPQLHRAKNWHLVPIREIANQVGCSEPDWRSETGLEDKYEKFHNAFEANQTPSDLGTDKAFTRQFSYRKQENYSHDQSKPHNTNTVMIPLPAGTTEPHTTTGVPVFGGVAASPQRFFDYMFEQEAKHHPVPILDRDWENFLTTNCALGSPNQEAEGTWAIYKPTYDAAGRLPIFYVGDPGADDGSFAFGFTRLFRLPHKYALGQYLKDHRVTVDDDGDLKPDFCESLFGHVYEEDDLPENRPEGQTSIARKGRIAISFSRPKEGSTFVRWPQQGTIRTIQSAPKFFPPFYLVGPVKDFSASPTETKPAGRKFYKPRHVASQHASAETQLQVKLESATRPPHYNRTGGGAGVFSQLAFLKPEGEDARMVNTIRLHNVLPEELGGVLWGLTFGGGAEGAKCRHMIGRAKAFGAGQARVARISARIRMHSGETHQWTWQHGGDGANQEAAQGSAAHLLHAFETWIGKASGCGSALDWRQSPPIAELLAIQQPGGWNKPEFDYLPFDNNGNRFKKLRDATGWLRDENAPPPRRLLDKL